MSDAWWHLQTRSPSVRRGRPVDHTGETRQPEAEVVARARKTHARIAKANGVADEEIDVRILKRPSANPAPPPAWLSRWPPAGYQATEHASAVVPELAPLRGWWWSWLGPGATPPVHGYRLHRDGIDALYFSTPHRAQLCQLDLDGVLHTRHEGSLDHLVALLAEVTVPDS